jgi:hypothetical protein
MGSVQELYSIATDMWLAGERRMMAVEELGRMARRRNTEAKKCLGRIARDFSLPDEIRDEAISCLGDRNE